MENKYYQPSILDFHVGFQYEYLPKGESEWVKKTVNTCTNLIDIEDVFNERLDGQIRVKCLDHDDILAAGFVFKMEFDRQRTYKGEYPTKIEYEIGDKWKDSGSGGFLTFYPETSVVKITTTDVGFNQDGPNNSVKFNGKILNRSELNFIMRRLGIV